ncbi:HNH endonuclease [Hymenobacter sp. IS2118]|uniref:HNH endonuclease n=1 Tax=Hymenobacter sp. IS2118 TaxID=1505605 RepID=UPI00054EC2C0|nr:HNH endonuclease signature motif containing protein [Hymenobacter sp. IS2118]
MAATRKCLSTDDEFRQAVAQSLSVRQVLSRIGLVPAGGNYKTVHSRIARLGLDTSHFTGAAWNVGVRYRSFGRKAELREILVEHSPYAFTHGLRRRLLKEGVKQHRCEACGLNTWQGQPIPLELHHQNGVNNDHRLENLQLLCPNCHAQTTSYRGKNHLKSFARVV